MHAPISVNLQLLTCEVVASHIARVIAVESVCIEAICIAKLVVKDLYHFRIEINVMLPKTLAWRKRCSPNKQRMMKHGRGKALMTKIVLKIY